TGLGLYISRALIERMGGSIQAASRADGGSRFSVGLPVDPHTEWREISRLPAADTVAERAEMELLNGHVLVAEDDDLLRELLQAILLDFGLSVEIVGNGLEAVEAMARTRFDAVLMDMHMPIMDGRTAARQLRDMGYRLPIIALSADVVGDSIKAHLSAGCSHVLPKPASRVQLHAMLSSCLPEPRVH
ncbi:MAG: response regulator, partial [Xanthomonadales bacterium]|nr:response regulator [Xanthomonadales bacterium]